MAELWLRTILNPILNLRLFRLGFLPKLSFWFGRGVCGVYYYNPVKGTVFNFM